MQAWAPPHATRKMCRPHPFLKVTRPSLKSDGITKTQYPHPQNPSRDKTENDAQSRLKALAKTDNGDEINMCMTKRRPDSVLPLLTGYTIRQEKHAVALSKRLRHTRNKSKERPNSEK